MPKIRTETLEDHNAAVWTALRNGLEKLLASKSYDEITLADVAAAAGIARNTIYNYAADKATLVAAAAEMSSNDLLDQVARVASGRNAAPERLSTIIETILEWFGSAKHRHLALQTLFQSVPAAVQRRAAAPLTRIEGYVAMVVKTGMKSGAFRKLENLDLTVQLMAGVVHYAALRIVHAPDQLEGITREVKTVTLAMLANSHAAKK